MTRSRTGRPLALVAAIGLLLAACAGGGAPAPTFTQDGYTVSCSWSRSAINGQPTPVGNNEAISFCRSRAREAVGTIIAQVPGNPPIESVAIIADGSATVCYGAGSPVCESVLGPLPR
jgi:hypothetical protein